MDDITRPPAELYAELEPVGWSSGRRVGQRRKSHRSGRARRIALLLLLAATPVAVAAIYLFAFAADRFESEAVFLVRNTVQPGVTTSGAGRQASEVFAQATLPLASDDSFAVREFILSRDAMRLAAAQLDLRRALTGPPEDHGWLVRLLFEDDSQEALYRTYLRHVTLHYDFNTNVSALRVQASTPADAQQLAAVLLTAAEDLVNQLNLRGQQAAIQDAAGDVLRGRDAAHLAIDRLMAFRVREQVVDPSGTAKVLSEVLVNLLGQLIDTRAQIDIMRITARHSPQLASLEATAISMQRQIDAEKAGIGHGDAALAPQLAEYERLELDRDFASHALMTALTAQESARQDAARKRVYLEHIAVPMAPDEARYPWRVLDLLGVAAAALAMTALFFPKMPHRMARPTPPWVR